MSSQQFIDEFQKLAPAEQAGVLDWILSEADDDALLSAFDRLPRQTQLTEEETLALPRRARAAGQ